jgi:hypothetical protein
MDDIEGDQAILKATGVSQEYLNQLIEAANSDDKDAQKIAKERLEDFFG